MKNGKSQRRAWSDPANKALLVNRGEVRTLLGNLAHHTEAAIDRAVAEAMAAHEREFHPIRRTMKWVRGLIYGRDGGKEPSTAPETPEGALDRLVPAEEPAEAKGEAQNG